MEKDVLKRYGFADRNDALKFLKSLWEEKPLPCPKCGGVIDYLHKGRKKDSCDRKCIGCGERYDTIKMLNELNEK